MSFQLTIRPDSPNKMDLVCQAVNNAHLMGHYGVDTGKYRISICLRSHIDYLPVFDVFTSNKVSIQAVTFAALERVLLDLIDSSVL